MDSTGYSKGVGGVEMENLNEDFLDVDVQKAGLSTRITNVLWQENIKTFRELINFTPKQLLSFRNMGKIGVCEIEKFLLEKNSTLKKDFVFDCNAKKELILGSMKKIDLLTFEMSELKKQLKTLLDKLD